MLTPFPVLNALITIIAFILFIAVLFAPLFISISRDHKRVQVEMDAANRANGFY
jgi:hypothetical protein